MANRLETYRAIAHILSLDTSQSELEAMLQQPNFDWNAIVVEGSKHLVLPAIYCSLKRKQLLHCLPEELVSYLKEITTINRNRNGELFKQAKEISIILNRLNINHVFIKGIALITSGTFDDMSQRMIGDIDILIQKSEANIAFELLQNNSYTQTIGFNYKIKGYRHLSRLINHNKLAAVEIHTDLFNGQHQGIINLKKVFDKKDVSKSIPIPDIKSIYEYSILSWQINSRGYYFLDVSFKVLFDCINIIRHNPHFDYAQFSRKKYFKTFNSLGSLFFKEYNDNSALLFPVLWYKLKTKYKVIFTLDRTIRYLFIEVFTRIILMFNNKSYRNHVLKTIFIPKN